MKLIIIRHCDPDYSIDSLTEEGWKEADALAEYMEKVPADYYYVSPLGRAKDTAGVCMKRIGKEAEELPWLREFHCPVKNKPGADADYSAYAWDWRPKDWTAREAFFNKDTWMDEPEFKDPDMRGCYKSVTDAFDGLLAEHGYEREGLFYRAVKPNHDTLVFFCHFGLECVLLSHLLNVSPMILWHGTVSAPSGVTRLVTEERQEGIACFRMQEFGSTAHLWEKGIEPAFHARFCECFTDTERH